jgi:hypothetical protein
MRALAHITKKNPGSAVTRAGARHSKVSNDDLLIEFVGSIQA